MKHIYLFVLLQVVLLSFACHTNETVSLNLDRLDLGHMAQRKDFLEMLSQLIKGQETCVFSDALLKRITFGADGYPQQGQYVPTRKVCIRDVAITEFWVDEPSSAGIFLSGRPHGEYFVQALLEDGRWLFYWPEPLGALHPNLN